MLVEAYYRGVYWPVLLGVTALIQENDIRIKNGQYTRLTKEHICDPLGVLDIYMNIIERVEELKEEGREDQINQYLKDKSINIRNFWKAYNKFFELMDSVKADDKLDDFNADILFKREWNRDQVRLSFASGFLHNLYNNGYTINKDGDHRAINNKSLVINDKRYQYCVGIPYNINLNPGTIKVINSPILLTKEDVQDIKEMQNKILNKKDS
jgi:hypothetical protein